MNITKHSLSASEFINLNFTNTSTILFYISVFILLTTLFTIGIAISRIMFSDKKRKFTILTIFISSILALSLISFLTADYVSRFTSPNYYSVNGKAKINHVELNSINNTQKVFFNQNSYRYTVQIPNNKEINENDIIQIKSSKYAAVIDNGKIYESDIKNQTFDIDVISK